MAKRTAIGLDIGSTAVRAVELSSGRSGLVLERIGQVALPDAAVRDGEVVDAPAVVSALRQLWSGARFTHREVALGVANQRVIVRQVDVPAMRRADLKAALPFQVQDLLPMPVEAAVLDFHPLEAVTAPTGAPMQRGLLVAAAHDMIMANVTAVQAAGLTVRTVDLTPFALLRAVGARWDLDVHTEALVDVGARVTNIVVHSGGVPRFVRILLLGGQDVTDAIAGRSAVPPQEAEALKQQHGLRAGTAGTDRVVQAATTAVQAFVEEVRSSLAYYAASQPTDPVDRVVLTGGGSLVRGLSERLEAVTGLPVAAGDALAGFATGRTGLDDDQLSAIAPLAAVPAGLALGDAR